MRISNPGIPSNADLNQLEDHWRKCHQLHPHALTILTKLFRNMEEVQSSEKILFRKSNCFYLVIEIRTTYEIFQ